MTTQCHEVVKTARDMQDWVPFVEPWAADSIKRALVTVIEFYKEGGSKEDPAPLPAYAEKTVRAAISHVSKVVRYREAEAEKFSRTRKPVHVF